MDFDNYAWDGVKNMELPMESVREARKEEMQHMKGKTFKVVKRAEAFEVTRKSPISTKWVDADKPHGVGRSRCDPGGRPGTSSPTGSEIEKIYSARHHLWSC